jgi:hypothetical protein
VIVRLQVLLDQPLLIAVAELGYHWFLAGLPRHYVRKRVSFTSRPQNSSYMSRSSWGVRLLRWNKPRRSRSLLLDDDAAGC